MSDTVYIEELSAGLKRLVLNSPQNLNAMDEKMATEFRAAVESLRSDSSLRRLVLCGEGRAFSAGGNISMLREKVAKPYEQNVSEMMGFYESFLSIRHIPVPTIAALHGHAIGAGLCLALACDFRVAASEAKLGLNFVKIGLHPGMGATYFLPRLLGPAAAAELLFSGTVLRAKDAHQLGMLNAVVPSKKFQAGLDTFLAQLEGSGPEAVRQLKQTLCSAREAELRLALQREAEAQAENFQSAEFLEGITAVEEKRSAKF